MPGEFRDESAGSGERADLPWFALYTKHKHEKSAATVLDGKGIETFLPLYRTKRVWSDRKQTLDVPLFPCYVFVRANPARKLDILRTPGVFGLVGSGGLAAEIPADEIDSVRKIVGGGVRYEPHPFLASGDRVRVRSGPLAGLEGILNRVKSPWRVVVSVQLLKQSAAVEVDLAIVERVGAARDLAVSLNNDVRKRED